MNRGNNRYHCKNPHGCSQSDYTGFIINGQEQQGSSHHYIEVQWSNFKSTILHLFREWLAKNFQENLISFFSWFEYLVQQCLWASSRGRPASKQSHLVKILHQRCDRQPEWRPSLLRHNSFPDFLSWICVQFFHKINWFFFLFIYVCFVFLYYTSSFEKFSAWPRRKKIIFNVWSFGQIRCWAKNFSASPYNFFSFTWYTVVHNKQQTFDNRI